LKLPLYFIQIKKLAEVFSFMHVDKNKSLLQNKEVIYGLTITTNLGEDKMIYIVLL